MTRRYPLDPLGPEAAEVRATLRARDQVLRGEVRAADSELAAADGAEREVGDRKDEAMQRQRSEVGEAEVARDLAELHEIGAALQRLEQGRYGLCQDCDEPIAAARLAAEVFAVRCAACQARSEQAHLLRR